MNQKTVICDLIRSNEELQAALRWAIVTIKTQHKNPQGSPDLILGVLDKVQAEGSAVLRKAQGFSRHG